MTTDHDAPDPIDELVAGLRNDVPEMSERAFAVGRTHLLLVVEPEPVAATPEGTEPAVPPRRRWLLRSPPGRLVVSAAAVVVLAAGVLVVQTTNFDDNAPVASAAAAQLNSAAEKITVTDEPLRPGKYRYIVTRSWDMSSSSVVSTDGTTSDMGLTYLAESMSELWVPAEPAQECTLHRTIGGNYKWLVGSDEKARELGVELPKPERMELRVPCGDFDGGAWQRPSTSFLASLPRDPDALYQRLREDTEGRGQDPDLEVLVYVTDVLRTGLVPADLRAALYRALAKVPGLEITERLANLDGHRGTAYGITRAGERNDVIIDPDTGQFIGERRIDLEGRLGVTPGTVTGYSSVANPVIVDELGATS